MSMDARSPQTPTRPPARQTRHRLWIPLLAAALIAQTVYVITHSTPPAQAQTATTLVSNQSKDTDTDIPVGTEQIVNAQGFTTGSNTGGYTLKSIEASFPWDIGETDRDVLRAELWSAHASGDKAGFPNARLAVLTVPAHPISAGTVSFAAPASTTLAASTKYFFVYYTTDDTDLPVDSTLVSGVDSGSAAGWTIDNHTHAQFANLPTAAGEWDDGFSEILKIAVKGVAKGATPPPSTTLPPALSMNADLGGLVVHTSTDNSDFSTALTLDQAVAAATTAYTAEVSHDVTHVKVTPTVADTGKATVTVNGSTVGSGTQSGSIALAVGANTVTVQVTAEDTSTTKDYVITLTRLPAAPAAPTGLAAAAGDMRLDLSWTAPSGTLTGYEVHYTSADAAASGDNVQDGDAVGTDAATEWAPVSHSGTAVSAEITGLANGTRYRVRVRAVNGAADGVWAFTSGTPTSAAALVSNAGQAAESSGASTDGAANAQGFTTGSNAAGYTLTAVEVVAASALAGSERDALRAELWSAHASGANAGQPNAKLADLAVPAEPVYAGTVSFAAPADTALAGSTKYFLVVYTTDASDVEINQTDDDDEDSGAAAGWSIDDQSYAKAAELPTASGAWTAYDETLQITVKGTQAAALPSVSLTASDGSGAVTVAEGSAATVKVSLSSALGSDVSIPVTVTDTTTVSSDRGALTAVTVTAGSTEATATISTVGDSVVEADETFTVALNTSSLPSSVTAGASTSVTVTIDDDDTPAAPTMPEVTAGDTRLDLSWTAPAGTLSGYDVHYTSAAAGTVTNDAAVSASAPHDPATEWVDASHSGTTATHRISGLGNGTTYRVRVRAVSAAGDGVWAHTSGMPEAPALPAVSLTANDDTGAVSVTEGSDATVKVSLSSALGSNVSIPVSLSDDTATSGDYGSLTAVSVTAGHTSATATVSTTVDSVNEAHETFTVALDTANLPSGVQAASATSVTVTITDNDAPAAPGSFSVSAGDASLSVSWAAPAGPVGGYQVRHKTTAATDAAATTPGDPSTGWVAADVAAAATSAEITAGVANDTAYSVQVRASDGQTGTGNGYGAWTTAKSATPEASALPAITLTVSDDEVSEADNAAARAVTVTATVAAAVASDVSVTLSRHSTSTAAAADYTGGASITISMGATSGTAVLTILDDSAVEARETLVLAAAAAGYSNPVAGRASLTIVDDDTADAPSMLRARGAAAALSVSWTAPAGTLSGYDVHYTSADALSGGDNVQDGDAVSPSAPHDPATEWVDANHSGIAASQRISGLVDGTLYRVRVRAVSSAGDGAWAHASGTPAAAGVTVSETGRTVEVGETTTYTVKLNSEPTSNVVVGVTSSATARATVSPGALTFTGGSSGNWATPQTVTVTGKATGSVTISHAVTSSTDTSYPTSLSIASVPVTVTASTKTYSIADVTVAEDASSGAALTVTLGRAAPAGGLAFTVAVADGTAVAADRGTDPTSVTVAQGATTAALSVPLNDDDLVENSETFTVTLSTSVSGWNPATTGAGAATVTVTDDDKDSARIAFGSNTATDPARTSTWTQTNDENASNGDAVSITVPVVVSHLPAVATRFDITVTSDGTGFHAAAGFEAEEFDAGDDGIEGTGDDKPGDFKIATKSVTFGPATARKQDLTIELTADEWVELDETIKLMIDAADTMPGTVGAFGDLGDYYSRDTVTGNSDTDGAGSMAVVTIDDDEADVATVAFGDDAASMAKLNVSRPENNPDGTSGGGACVNITLSHQPDPVDYLNVPVEVLTTGTATRSLPGDDGRFDTGDAGEVVGDFNNDASATVPFFNLHNPLPTPWCARLVADSLVEADQTIEVRIADPDPAYESADNLLGNRLARHAQSRLARIIIEDDERRAAKAVFGGDTDSETKLVRTVSETSSRLLVPVTITALPEVSSDFTISVAGGTAEEFTDPANPGDGDFRIADKTLTFNAASATTQNIEIEVRNDDLVENDQTIELEISSGTGFFSHYGGHAQAKLAQAKVTDDDRTTARIVIGADTASETAYVDTGAETTPQTTLTVQVTISHLPQASTTFDIDLAGSARKTADPDNSSGNPADYSISAETVTFGPTTAETQDLTVTVVDDSVEEDPETVTLKIAAADTMPGTFGAFGDLGDYYLRTGGSEATLTLRSEDEVASVELGVSIAPTPDMRLLAVEGAALTLTATAFDSDGDAIAVGPDGWTVTVASMHKPSLRTYLSRVCANSATTPPNNAAGFACPNDYRLPRPFTIAEGQTAATATLTLVSDDRDEPDAERLPLSATARRPAKQTAGRSARRLATNSLELQVSDTSAGIDLTATSLELVPDEAAAYRVALRGAAPATDVVITPTVSDTTKAAVTCATDPCRLTFTPGNWNTFQDVTVTAKAAGEATITHPVTSADTTYGQLTLPAVAVEVAAAKMEYSIDVETTATEGETAELVITLGQVAPAGGLVFSVDRGRTGADVVQGHRVPDRTADPDNDLDASPPTTVTVAAGERRATLGEPLADDDLVEADEHYWVVVSTTASGWTPTSAPGRECHNDSDAGDAACAKVTITDSGDRAQAAVAFGDTAGRETAYTATADEDAGTIEVPITVTALPHEPVTFTIEALTGGADPATEGADYTITDPTVTFGPSTAKTQNVVVAIVDDDAGEPDEQIRLRIAPAGGFGANYRRHASGATATITIANDDAGVHISAQDEVVLATGETSTYTVALAGTRPTGEVTVTPESDDTDIAAVACEAADPCVLRFDSTNWNQTQTVTITGGATAGTAAISHTVGGTDPAYPQTLQADTVTVRVTSLPTAVLAVTPRTVTEGGTLTVTVTLSQALDTDAVIPLTFTGSATRGSDYTAPGNITVTAGDTTATATITTTDDTADENNETITVTLGDLPATLTQGSTTSVTVTINDNDETTTEVPTNIGGPTGGGGGGGAAPPDPADEFTDLDTAGIFTDQVTQLAKDGVLARTGCRTGHLCPNEPIRRWEMAVWLIRVLNPDKPNPGRPNRSRFTDVRAGRWWAGHVEQLARQRITLGCATEPAMFCPNDPVTRAQMASFLTRAFKLAAADPAGFTDTADTGHDNDIDALHAVRITLGCTTEPLQFCPQLPTTRAQMAAFLTRALNYIKTRQPS